MRVRCHTETSAAGSVYLHLRASDDRRLLCGVQANLAVDPVLALWFTLSLSGRADRARGHFDRWSRWSGFGGEPARLPVRLRMQCAEDYAAARASGRALRKFLGTATYQRLVACCAVAEVP